MKKTRIKAIILILVMTLICVILPSCGTNLAASAGGINSDSTEEVSTDTDIEENDNEYSEEAEEDSDNEIENENVEDTEDTDNASDDSAETYTIVYNSNPDRKRYHLPTCRGVDEISEEHYEEYELTIEEIKEKQDDHGWIACGWCHPDRKLGIE